MTRRFLFRTLAPFLILGGLLAGGSALAQDVLLRESFDDGDLTANPPWLFFNEAAVCFQVDSTRFVSAPYSLRVSTSEQRATLQTTTYIYSKTMPFSVEMKVYVEEMGDEAIPLFLEGRSLVLFLFLLPNGRVQLSVLKTTSGWNAVNLNVDHGYRTGQWHTFKVAYDGRRNVFLYIDGTLKGTLNQPLVDAPALLNIGNPSVPHTSTFYVDDLRIVGQKAAQSPPGKIYFILCSDTGTWDGLNMSKHVNFYRFGLFSDPGSNSYKVIQAPFRNRYRDSRGRPLVMTWFMLVGSLMAYNSNPEVQYPWISNLEMMKKYHGADLEAVGDELSFHYHNWVWSDPDGDGVYHWNQSVDFREYRDNFLETLGHLMVEGGLLPTSFRSGWHYMDNQWEALLDTLIPYRLENYSPVKHTDTTEPLDNIVDWSRAPLDWLPYHPDAQDYQSPGNLRGWETRCKYMKSLTVSDYLTLFSEASKGKDQVVTLWSHLPEKDFPAQIALVDSLIHKAALFYGDVDWEYCTATEAMQRWRGTADRTPPKIHCTVTYSDSALGLAISVSEPLWQPAPLVAVKRRSSKVELLFADSLSAGRWELEIPAGRDPVVRLAVGATDTAGNSSVLQVDVQTAVAEPGANSILPVRLRLAPPFPNPAREGVFFRWAAPAGSPIELTVFNVLGQTVWHRTLAQPAPGMHVWRLGTGSWPAGLYVVRLQAGGALRVRKFLVQK